MDRTNLPLAKHEPRCEPKLGPCTMGNKCARRIALIVGSPIEDFTIRALGGTGLCPGYLPAATVRMQAAAPVAPRVHPPMGSKP